MSDQKTPKQDDIVATSADAPETISDEALNDVDGGYFTITMTNATATTMDAGKLVSGINADTIYAGDADDSILDSESILRTRPGRFSGPW